MEYVYLGDRLTNPMLIGMGCRAVRDGRGKCVRGKNGSMLVENIQGDQFAVLGYHLRRLDRSDPAVLQGMVEKRREAARSRWQWQ